MHKTGWGSVHISETEAGSVYFDRGRFLPTRCYDMFPKARCEEISENKELASELSGRDNHNNQLGSQPLTSFSLFFLHRHQQSHGDAGGKGSFSFVSPSVLLPVSVISN
jgi:hypothetical protein